MTQSDFPGPSPTPFLQALKSDDEQALKLIYTKNYRGVEQYIMKNNGTIEDA